LVGEGALLLVAPTFKALLERDCVAGAIELAYIHEA
jgi:hypothetical protein